MKADQYKQRLGKKIGFTNTLGKETLPKSHILIETLGNLDEANSMIGFARSQCRFPKIAEMLLAIQKDLGTIMAHVATMGNNPSKIIFFPQKRFTWLEKKNEELKQAIKIPRCFIQPGETSFSAILDLCRTTVRKAERRLAEVHLQELTTDSLGLQYLNTLSQLLFFLEIKTISDESTHPDRAISK
jgi:cob(I)alamin adenosyltransferase